MTYTYSQLIGTRDTDGSIANWVNATNLPVAVLLSEAEDWIWNRLRIRENREKTVATLAANASSIALSTFANYRQAESFRFLGTTAGVGAYRPLRKRVDFVEDVQTWDGDGNLIQGDPQFWATDEDDILFEVRNRTERPYQFRYFIALPHLSGSNETNVLTDKYSTLLRTACLMKAAEWQKNDRESVKNKALAEAQILGAELDSDREQEGIDLVVVPE